MHHPYRSQVLDCLGLVASMFDELGMAMSSTRQHNYISKGHGWRLAVSITRFYTTVEAFLRQHVLLT